MNIYYGDVKIDGSGITWKQGQPVMDAGLSTAVYLSIFTDLGWWGDKEIGSKLYEYDDATLTQDVALSIIEYVKTATKWLVDDGIADEVNVKGEIQRPDFLAIQVEVKEPAKDPTTYRYGISWRETEEAL